VHQSVQRHITVCEQPRFMGGVCAA